MSISTRQITLMGMFIALNVTLGGLVHILKLPVFIDAVGTILAAVLIGLMPAILVGIISFVIAAALISPVYIWFVGTQAVIATVCYFAAAKFSAFRSLPRAIITGLILGVVAAVVSAPVIVFVFGGVAGSGRDLITAALMNAGNQVFKAVFLSGAASEPIDKVLQSVIAFAILRSLPQRLLGQFRNPVLEQNRAG